MVLFDEYGLFHVTSPGLLAIVAGGDPASVNYSCMSGQGNSGDELASVNVSCTSRISQLAGVNALCESNNYCAVGVNGLCTWSSSTPNVRCTASLNGACT
jgi:hypothetical protein